MGLYLKQRLAAVVDAHPDVVAEVRGEGLLIGVRCIKPVGRRGRRHARARTCSAPAPATMSCACCRR